MHYAAYKGSLTTLKWLLDHDVPCTARNAKGQTMLHMAAMGGNIAALQWSNDRGILDMNALDESAETLAHCAAKQGQVQTVIWLAEHGCNIFALNQKVSIQTIYHRATIFQGDVRISLTLTLRRINPQWIWYAKCDWTMLRLCKSTCARHNVRQTIVPIYIYIYIYVQTRISFLLW
jgi:ankyrin repeat protein